MDDATRESIEAYLHSDRNLNNILYTARFIARDRDLTIIFEGMYNNGTSKHPFVLGQTREQIKQLELGIIGASMLMTLGKEYTINQGTVSSKHISFKQWREPWTSATMGDPNPGEFGGKSIDGVTYEGEWRGTFQAHGEEQKQTGSFVMIKVNPNISFK